MEACYTDPKMAVVKFRCGLNPQIQNAVATMVSGRPADNDLSVWYSCARTIDQNRAINSVGHRYGYTRQVDGYGYRGYGY